MMEFDSFGAFARHLMTRELVLHEALHVGLEVVADKITKTAKDEIGIYQPQVGEFPAWAPLAEYTIQDRIAKGYSADEPLLREGNLRDSISNEVHELEAVVGSTSDIAVYQELGTVRIPPRPFLGPASIHEERFTLATIGAAAAAALGGEEKVYLSHAYTLKGKE